MQSQSGNAESIRQDLIAAVPRITDDVCPSDRLDRFIHRAEPCFCGNLQPGARGRLSLPIPPATDGLYFDHRGFRHFRGDNGLHDNDGFTAMVASTILAEALATAAAWDTVEAQGVAVRVKVEVQYIRVNRNSRPQTCVQSLAFCEMQMRREKAPKHCLP